MSKTDRRDFLIKTGSGALVAGVGGMGLLEGDALAAGKKEAKARVVVVRGTDPARMLRAALKVFRGMGDMVKGKRVVIKPNMAWTNPPAWANNTSPAVAHAVALLCQEAGAKKIAAVDHTMGEAGKSIKACGVGAALEQVKGVEIVSLHDKKDYVKRRVPRGKQLKSTELARVVTGDDLFLINVPVAKHHGATRVSFGLKNLMGLVWNRGHFHSMINLHQGIADLASLIPPGLTVIDAMSVMTSGGPQGPGKVEKLNTLVVSTDPVAADAVALGLTRWDKQKLEPAQVAHIMMAEKLGLGVADLSKIKIIKKKV